LWDAVGVIYKLLTTAEWEAAREAGEFRGSAVDLADGYVHFSSAEQVVETAQRYFEGQRGLTMLGVDENTLGDGLRWEPSRGGALFPHLYAALPVGSVVTAVPLDEDLPVADAVAAAL
jgi:uncharacterized protein (DUF952 family)